jgi:hypothetical protein
VRRVMDAIPRNRVCYLGDTGIVRASKLEQAVQGRSSDGNFGHLGSVGARSKGIANHSFVSPDRRLDLGSQIVAAGLLPRHPAAFGDQVQSDHQTEHRVEPTSVDQRITAALADGDQPRPFSELRASCRVRTTTLYERLAAMIAAGSVVKSADGYSLAGGTIQTFGGSCRLGKGRVCIADPVKSMPDSGTERAVVDCATNLEQQISAIS